MAPAQDARLHACLELAANGMSRQTGSIIHPIRACAPLLHQRPANLMPPEVGMVRGNAPYWHRLVRPVHLCCWPLPCARGATPDASMADTLRYATRWRLPRSGQPSIIGQCIKEKHNLSTAETLPESCNNCAREEASHQGLIRFCRTATHSWER
jgi:hypothetical protein